MVLNPYLKRTLTVLAAPVWIPCVLLGGLALYVLVHVVVSVLWPFYYIKTGRSLFSDIDTPTW